MIDDGFLAVSRLIDQLRADLKAISEAEPGSHDHRQAITRYTDTYAKLGRSAYTKHVPFPIPSERRLPE